MSVRILCLATLALALLSVPVEAQERPLRITPTIGALWLESEGDAGFQFDSDRFDVGATASYGIVAEWAIDRRWSAGGGFAYAAPSPEIVSDDPRLEPPADRVSLELDVWTLDVRVARRWPDLGLVVPRVEAGIGMIRLTAGGEGSVAPPCFFTGGLSCDVVYPWDGSENALLLHLGAGIEAPMGERWGIRASAVDRMQLCARGEGESRPDVLLFACGPPGERSLLHHVGAEVGVTFHP